MGKSITREITVGAKMKWELMARAAITNPTTTSSTRTNAITAKTQATKVEATRAIPTTKEEGLASRTRDNTASTTNLSEEEMVKHVAHQRMTETIMHTSTGTRDFKNTVPTTTRCSILTTTSSRIS